MKLISLFVVMLLFSACGYTPSAKFSREVVGETISTSVIISARDPENTVIVKDAVDAAIIEVFHASLTTSDLSQTQLALRLGNPSYSPVQYNAEGFIVAYRTAISLSITRHSGGESKLYKVRGTYDFTIQPNAIVSDKQRFDAIKFSSIKAIQAFVAQVSAEGAREKKKTETIDNEEITKD